MLGFSCLKAGKFKNKSQDTSQALNTYSEPVSFKMRSNTAWNSSGLECESVFKLTHCIRRIYNATVIHPVFRRVLSSITHLCIYILRYNWPNVLKYFFFRYGSRMLELNGDAPRLRTAGAVECLPAGLCCLEAPPPFPQPRPPREVQRTASTASGAGPCRLARTTYQQTWCRAADWAAVFPKNNSICQKKTTKHWKKCVPNFFLEKDSVLTSKSKIILKRNNQM